MTKHLPTTERQRQILSAARQVFVQSGYAATRVEDVAKAAGLSKGAVYFYFPSKQALFLGVVLEDHNEAYELLNEIEHSSDQAIVKLLRIGLHYAGRFSAETRSDDGPTRFFIMMCEIATRDPALRDECHGLHSRIVGTITRILAQGIFEQEFREMDPQAVALMLKATIDGFACHMAIGASADTATMRTDGFSTILRGILREPSRAEPLLQVFSAVDPTEVT
jgi:AcrR family transcriptional regulator